MGTWDIQQEKPQLDLVQRTIISMNYLHLI